MSTRHHHAFARLWARLARAFTPAPAAPVDPVIDQSVRGIPPCSLHFEETGIRIRYVPRERPPCDE